MTGKEANKLAQKPNILHTKFQSYTENLLS